MDHSWKVLGASRIVAITKPDNYDSKNVLKKLGFRYDRMVRILDDECAHFVADSPER